MQKLVAGQSLELRFPELQLYAEKSYQNNAADGANESDDNSSTTSTLDEGNVFFSFENCQAIIETSLLFHCSCVPLCLKFIP